MSFKLALHSVSYAGVWTGQTRLALPEFGLEEPNDVDSPGCSKRLRGAARGSRRASRREWRNG